MGATPARAALVAALTLWAGPAVAVPLAPAAALQAAARRALAVPGGEVEVLAVEGGLPPGCAHGRIEFPQPVATSGRAAAHLMGRAGEAARCEAWAWVRLRVTGPALVTTRAVPRDGALAGAVEARPRELLPGRAVVATLPEGAVADHAIPPGTPVDPAAVRIGPRPGSPVTVLLRTGALTVEQSGRAVACRRDRACALLPSGRRVEGSWHDGRITLEAP